MNKVKRLLKYEWARLKAYKTWFAVLAAAAVIILTGIGVGFALKSASPVMSVDKAAAMQEYRQQLETDQAILQAHVDDLTDFEKFRVGREIEKLQFFLDTDTTESDYLSISDYTGKMQGYEAFGFCVYFFEYSSYFFMALAVAGALWAFSVETQVHSIKNLLAAPTDRKSIFAVKTVVSAGAVLIVPVILFVVFLVVCGCVPNGSFLIYAGGYKAVGGLHVFAQLGLRNVLVILCIYAVTLLCSVCFKPLTATLIPVLGYFGLAFLAMTVTSRQSFIMLGVTAFDAFNFFPVIGLQNYLGGFDINFLAMALVHVAAVCLLSFATYKRFMKRDF